MTQTSPAAARQLDAIPVHRKSLSQRLRENWQLYVMLLIPVVLTIVYKYWPMYGIQIAFRDFKASRGITGSEWVGLYWFERFFTAPNCVRMIKNTVLLSLYSLLWSFPIPIILSLCINQLRFAKFKRVVQTVLYAPHFISTMVICGMIKIFLSPSGGLLNLILGTSVDFLSESAAFRTIYVASGIWQEAGWGTIIYMACLAAVDTSLYEAAKIDGASMFQRILHIAAAHFCCAAFSVCLQHKRECVLQADIFNLVGICRIIADVALRNLYSGFLQQLVIVLFMAYKSHGAAAGICDIYRAQPLRGRQHHKR